MWECLAGESPLSSYGVGASEELLGNVPRQHLEFLESRCCDSHETEEFIFVHGGIQPHQNPAEEDRDRLQWSALSSCRTSYLRVTNCCLRPHFSVEWHYC